VRIPTYELYQSVEEIENATFFLSYKYFVNNLFAPTEVHIHTMNRIIEKKIKEGLWLDFIDVLANTNLVRASCQSFW